jgi:hypothetical protein
MICALTTLVVEIYHTPEPALAAYVAFFVMKPDRAASVVTSVVMLLLISFIVGLVLVLSIQVIEQPLWRVTAMTLVPFCLTFAASASKLKPVAGTIALITTYALDLLGSIPGGKFATRGILYVWLFVGIPAGVSTPASHRVRLARGPHGPPLGRIVPCGCVRTYPPDGGRRWAARGASAHPGNVACAGCRPRCGDPGGVSVWLAERVRIAR